MEDLPISPLLRKEGMKGRCRNNNPSDFLLAKEEKEGWL